MRIVAHRGNREHAPENSRIALISGYTAGADALELDLQLSRDGHLVLSHDPTITRLTGQPGDIREMTLAELRQLNFAATFAPRHAPGFAYYDPRVTGRRVQIETLPEILDALPDDATLLVEIKHDSSLATGRRDEFVSKALGVLRERQALTRAIVYSKDSETVMLVRRLEPTLHVAAFDWELTPDAQLDLLTRTGADGLVTSVEAVLDEDLAPTPFAAALDKAWNAGLRLGALLYPRGGILTENQHAALARLPWVWSVSTDSVIQLAAFARRGVVHTAEDFTGTKVDTRRFALGYAKANAYATVSQDDGVHVRIESYDKPFPDPTDGLEGRIQRLENQMLFVARDWPYYSGGGLGTVTGIRGDFAAEVSYTVERVQQATTLEMAVTNVDPGAHQASRPRSFRGKHAFYDPHGCPPYVGVEHDENDGYRINWNLGNEPDSNQYGKPVGDGAAPRAARLRLERRGSYFSAYYRQPSDDQGRALVPRDWVCVGVALNESLNRTVFLRCAGKRWRQEKESDPSEFEPVIPNHFMFRDLRIVVFPSQTL